MEASSPTLYIRLLGDFHLVYGDETVTGLRTTHLKSLLAYLVLHHNVPQPRQRLAFLFSPGVMYISLTFAELQTASSLILAVLESHTITSRMKLPSGSTGGRNMQS
jgi:zinc transporter ZupT